jgi:mono/diheme cytochrome c family protein
MRRPIAPVQAGAMALVPIMLAAPAGPALIRGTTHGARQPLRPIPLPLQHLSPIARSKRFRWLAGAVIAAAAGALALSPELRPYRTTAPPSAAAEAPAAQHTGANVGRSAGMASVLAGDGSGPSNDAAPALDDAATSETLAARLGCGACHGEPLPPPAGSPPLADAGRKHHSSWIAAYLAAPTAVRPSLAPARMPSYPLHEGEAAAIAAYLATLELPTPLPSVRARRGDARRGRTFVTGAAGCTACHTVNGSGAGTAVELADVAQRLQPDWVRALLIDPEHVQPGSGMPAFFYERVARGYRERRPGAGAQLDDVLAFLFATGSGGTTGRGRADRELAGHGRALVEALGCAGCHLDLAPVHARSTAPDLRRSAAALRPAALRAYLASPHPVRPFGDPPGSGGRMPDFRLSEAELDSVVAWLHAHAAPPASGQLPAALPRYALGTAATLLRERLPCLGCHALDGEGGRIAPELGAVAARLEPAAIAAMVDDPAAHRPGSMMPRVPLSEYERRRVIGYLLTRDRAEAPTRYLPPREHPLLPLPGAPADGGHADYRRYCAACHGAHGNGRGFNAPYLGVAPTPHTDAGYMSERPDDSLHDAIAVGGRIMGRSPAMPMFGESLSPERLDALVSYMRELCGCDGPGWSAQR